MSLKHFLVNKPAVSKEMDANALPSAGASPPSSTAELAGVDDSFHIDLPPASQLDHSILAYLPTSMCQKILQRYEILGHSTVEIVKEEQCPKGAASKAPSSDVTEWRGGGAEMPEAEASAVTSAAARRGDGAMESIAEMRSSDAVVTIAENEAKRRRGSAMSTTTSTSSEDIRDVGGVYYEWRGGGGGGCVAAGRLEGENTRLSANSASHARGQVITRRSSHDTRLVMEVAVCDDRAFLDSWKKYVCKHFTSSSKPRDKDTRNAVEYLCTLSRTNLEMTELCLKNLRRFVVQQQYDLSPTFDIILQKVQAEVKECYHGVLKIEPLTF